MSGKPSFSRHPNAGFQNHAKLTQQLHSYVGPSRTEGLNTAREIQPCISGMIVSWTLTWQV